MGSFKRRLLPCLPLRGHHVLSREGHPPAGPYETAVCNFFFFGLTVGVVAWAAVILRVPLARSAGTQLYFWPSAYVELGGPPTTCKVAHDSGVSEYSTCCTRAHAVLVLTCVLVNRRTSN